MTNKINITQVNYVPEQSDNKRPDIDSHIGQYLLDAADRNNSKLSKSVIIYELLLYADVIPFEDNMSEIEQNINHQLENNGIDIDDVNDYNIKNIDIYSKYDYPEGDTTRMQVTFPKSVFESVDFERKWASTITEAVEYYLVRQFDSRQHRIDVKTDILGLATGSKSKSECTDLACDIYEYIQSESRFKIESHTDLKNKASLCDSVDDKKELLALYIKKYNSMSREAMVDKFIDAFDYSDIYYAHRIFNDVCKNNKFYEYNDFENTVLKNINWVEDALNSVKSHDDIDYVFIKLLQKHAKDRNERRLYLDKFVSMARNNNIISSNDIVDDLAKKVKEISNEYDDSGIDKIETGFVYFE